MRNLTYQPSFHQNIARKIASLFYNSFIPTHLYDFLSGNKNLGYISIQTTVFNLGVNVLFHLSLFATDCAKDIPSH